MASITRAARREWGRLRSVLSYLRREVKVRHTPLHLWIELTDKCNLRCVMCINSVVTKRHSGFMDMGLYRSIIDQVAGWRPKPLLSLFLGGESTLHPGIFEMISYADRKGLSTFLATNATTLTPTRSRRLIESGLENIIFSFDGYDKESYESVRVGANFERTVENIRTFLKIKRELNSKTPRVTFSSLITRSFEEEGERAKLEEFQHTFDGLPVDEFRISVAGHWAGTFDGINTPEFQEAVTYGDRFFPCFRLWESMSIRWDGTVVPCCVDFLGETPLGSAVEQPLLDIWNGPPMQEFRRKMIRQDISDISLCNKGSRGCEVLWPTETFMGAPLEMWPHLVHRLWKALKRFG